jgi:hypothetical protein
MAAIVDLIAGLAAKATTRIKALLTRWIDSMAERRRRKIQFEMQMYRGAYRYSTKNDDDLPIVH